MHGWSIIGHQSTPKEVDLAQREKPIKVSVVVPVYNTEPYLRRCLDSIVNQTLKEIEIICVNDGSTDASLAILKEYAAKDSRIILIDLKKNKGASNALNVGIGIAAGEFVGFVDSDDFIDPGWFENLYAHSKNYDWIRGIKLVNGQKRRDRYVFLTPSIIRTSFLMKHNIFFPTNRRKTEDVVYYKRLRRAKAKQKRAPDKGSYYHYERRLGSLSNWKPHQIPK